jgi:hypothetical protein
LTADIINLDDERARRALAQKAGEQGAASLVSALSAIPPGWALMIALGFAAYYFTQPQR